MGHNYLIMDNKAFISIQYLFSIFLLILIATSILFIATNSINSTQNIEKQLTYRIVLDDISDDINQVNSNGEGYSKKIELPDKILGDNYVLEVSNDKIIFKGGGKTAQNSLMPFTLVNDEIKIEEVKLQSGNSYIVKKHENSQISIDRVW